MGNGKRRSLKVSAWKVAAEKYVLNQRFLLVLIILFGAGFLFRGERVKLIDDFEERRETNLIGGSAGGFADRVRTSFVSDTRNDTETTVLRIDYLVTPDTFNGYFSGLDGFDARYYENLVFYARGGGRYPETFKVEVKNVSGESGEYHITNLESQWQLFKIPLEEFEGIEDISGLDEVVFVFEGEVLGDDAGTVLLDELKFTGSRSHYRSVDREIKAARRDTQRRIKELLELEEDDFLEEVSREIFEYFWKEAHPETGFIRDRTRKDSPSSIAATGFGLAAYCIGVERGWVERERAKERVLKILRKTSERAAGHEGFFYHFIDMETGERRWRSELSSVDTALLFGGIITAREYFDDPEITELSDELFLEINWPWMMDSETKALYMGWDPENGFDDYILWDMYAEQMIMNILGLGSPTHPLPEEAWDSFRRPVKTYDGITYIYCESESLFVYLFSHAFIDFRQRYDAYADYWENNRKAVKAHIAFCRNNPLGFRTFEEGFWGISAGDGPEGYRNHGATIFTTDGTVTPYAVAGSYPFVPEESLEGMRRMLEKYGEKLWDDEYGFISAFNLDRWWFSREHIGIDLGIMILMMENHRTEFVWDYFMRNEYVQRGMERAGFTEGVKEFEYKPEEPAELSVEERSYRARNIPSPGYLTESDYYEMDESMLEFGKIRDEKDLGARFAAGWNDENLFLSVDVIDDVIITDRRASFLFQHDSVEVYISPDRILEWGNPEHFQIGFSPSGPEGEPQRYAFFQREDPGENVQLESSIREGGYSIRAALSWDYLGVTPEPGKSLGFSVAVHDVDRPERDGAGGKKLNWAFKDTPHGILLGRLILGE